MGLDVFAYKGLTKLDVLYDADGEPISKDTKEPIVVDYMRVYINQHFRKQADDLIDKAVYGYADSEDFYSSGYGKYNWWREELAKLAGYEAVTYERVEGYAPSATLSHQVGACENYTEGAFYELCAFSDCEGTIGAKTSAKLAKDFADFEARARLIGVGFYENYIQFKKCFEFAAQNGCVKFG